MAVGLAMRRLERLAVQHLYRQSRDRDRLAPERLSLVLGLEGPTRKPGRPAVPKDVRALIRTMSRENPLWGAPRIHGELLKLGIDISETSVSKYLVRRQNPPSQKIGRAHV